MDILWNEIIPFAPRIFFTLESTSKIFKERLSHDPCKISWLLEENFSRQNVSLADIFVNRKLPKALLCEEESLVNFSDSQLLVYDVASSIVKKYNRPWESDSILPMLTLNKLQVL